MSHYGQDLLTTSGLCFALTRHVFPTLGITKAFYRHYLRSSNFLYSCVAMPDSL